MEITILLLATIGLLTLIYAACKIILLFIDQITAAQSAAPPRSFTETQDDFTLAMQRQITRDQAADQAAGP